MQKNEDSLGSGGKTDEVIWYDIKDGSHFYLGGSEALSESGFYRLSERERRIIEPVNKDVAWLAGNTAGIQARFSTDSPKIRVRVLLNQKHNMSHMTAVGQCGVDLYTYENSMGQYVLHGSSQYDINLEEYEVELGHFEKREMRKFILNFPLYSGVKNMAVGIDGASAVTPGAYGNSGKIVVYGTSIVQGGCVSRPGMLYTNILSRRLDTEFINLGFSGVAFAEKEMAIFAGSRTLQRLLIVDIEPNAGIDERMEQNLPGFISTYKAYQPDVPIILASRVLFALDLFDSKRAVLREKYRKMLKEMAKKYAAHGERVYFLDGSKTFKGNFTEYTVDGVHPTDLGAMELANSYFKAIILNDIIGSDYISKDAKKDEKYE